MTAGQAGSEPADQLEALSKWALGPGGLQLQQAGIKVCSIGDCGERGIVSSRVLPPNSPVLSLPYSSLLTVESIDPLGPLGPLLAHEPGLREDDMLVIALLYEKNCMGDKSKWAPHIALLPAHVPSAVTLSTEGIERIKGSALHPIALQLRSQIEEDFRDLCTKKLVRLEGASQLQPPSVYPWFTLDAYRWALSIVWSRFVTVSPDGRRQLKAMVPYFDMINHDPHTTMRHGLAADGRMYLLTGPEEVGPGELFISYGALPNLRLLLLYGFSLPDNPYDSVPFWASMSSQAPLYELKALTLQGLGLAQCLAQPFHLSLADPLPTSLLAALRVQRADVEELSRAVEAVRGPLSDRNECEVTAVLRAALSAMLGGLADAAEEGGGDQWDVYLRSERRVIRAAMQVVETMARTRMEREGSAGS